MHQNFSIQTIRMFYLHGFHLHHLSIFLTPQDFLSHRHKNDQPNPSYIPNLISKCYGKNFIKMLRKNGQNGENAIEPVADHNM